ncbi:MAG: cysteine synthase A [Phoenicibacter congonensis]|uniref:cysteine synthase n=1 Tax=Phoenicibacter congonensis TaxID=1944646 RepID=A0AA43RH80_9ACTN|nr:cysteine synthase A [Phoenicibacter congonensis]
MTNIIKSSEQLIGGTPLVELVATEAEAGGKANIYGKVEAYNLTGSVKDRIALSMIVEAEKAGQLKEGSVIIEPTSGNTGIGLSAVGVHKGYRVIIVMPETFSVERRKLMKAYGAEVVLSEGAGGMKGAIAKANELAAEIPNSFIPSQFTNPANWKAHYDTTGPELYDALDGKIDIVVSGVGTGGTLTGIGKFLHEKGVDVKMAAVEAAASPVLSGGAPGAHKVQGISPGFVADVLDMDVVDEIIKVENNDALKTGREFASKEGILVGISSGAAVWAAKQLAARPENEGKNIVVILPDSGDRYLSTALYEE